MSSETSHLSERGVAPEDDLVLGIAVGTDYFIGTLGPRQVAHLEGREGERKVW